MNTEVVQRLLQRVWDLEQQVAELREQAGLPPATPTQPAVREPSRTQSVPVRVTAAPSTQTKARPAGTTEQDLIGTWFPRVGALAILIGAGYAFKYAVDRGFIGPGARVMIGIAVSLAFVGWGEWAARRTWHRFAQAVAGGGVALCYLSVLAADNLYHLLPATSAFAFLLMVTIGGAALAARHNSVALAVMATVGAFLNPFVISPHRPDALPLFAYVIAIDVAIAVVARKRWAALDRVALVGTLAVVGLITGQATFVQRAIFATSLLLIFVLAYIIRDDDHEPPDVLFAAAASHYGYMLWAFDQAHPRYQGVFTLVMAAAYGSLAALTRSKQRMQFALLTTALAVIFVPIQFDGAVVGAAWALQGLLLLVLHTRGIGGHGSRVLGDIVLALAGIDALRAISEGYPQAQFALNATAAAVAVVITSLAFSSRLRTEGEPPYFRAIAAHTLALVWLSFEAAGAVHARERQILQFTLSGVWAVYATALIVYGIQARRRWARLLAVGLFGLVVAKLVVADLWLLRTGYRIVAFMGLGALLLATSVLYHRVKDVIAADDAPAP